MMSVSVVIPTFNRGVRIQATLDSALSQTQPPLEILVIDDGSTDGTADWIEANYSDKVRVIRQENAGVANARNRGLQEAQGDWIAFLDHDDTFHPKKLEILTKLEETEVGVLVPRWREVGSSEQQSPLFVVLNTFNWLFGWDNPIVSMSVPLIRRDLLTQIGGFDSSCVPADDWDIWLRLAKVTKFKFTNDVLVDYSLHDGQQRLDEQKMFNAVRKVLRKYPVELVKRPLLLWWFLSSKIFAATTVEYKRAKNRDNRAFLQALKKQPFLLLTPQWLLLLIRRIIQRG